MKKSLLAIGALASAVLTAGSGWAADMPRKAPLKKLPLVYSWTGFYVGGNVGWSFGKGTTDWTVAGVPSSTTANVNGALGGFQEGYNWQLNGWLVGFEADIQLTGQQGTSGLAATTGGVTAGLVDQAKLPWFGTIRGRVGLLPAERFLVYATGGAAYGDVNSIVGVTSGGIGGSVSSHFIHAGWTVGAGIEGALSDDWTAKLEYLYIDLGSVVSTINAFPPFSPIGTTVHLTDNIVRVGFNYHFGPAAMGGPAVMSKY